MGERPFSLSKIILIIKRGLNNWNDGDGAEKLVGIERD